MAHQTSSANYGTLTVQVWTRLTTEHRAQIIRLMAELAFKLILADPNSPLKEVQRVVVPDLTQDSS